MSKEYPIYVYVNDMGNTFTFAYKMTEEEMLQTKNGLYHYNYFADACKEFINHHCAYFAKAFYKRECGICTTMTPAEIFFTNLFKCKKDKIHYINPIVYKYDKISDVYGNVSLDQLIHDRYLNIVSDVMDKLDMISLKYFGTRAYTDLIAAANGIHPNTTVIVGQVLKIPLYLESALTDEAIKLYHGANVLSYKSLIKLNDAKLEFKNQNTKLADGTLLRAIYESYVYYKGKYIRVINYF